MFGHLKARSANRGGDPSAAAYLEELVGQRASVEAARVAASESCDNARLHLAAAQHSGDPQLILAAHRELESALKALRSSSIACERTRQALLGEKDVLGYAVIERPVGSGRAR